MSETQIVLLGDSTSMTVGLDRRTYPFLLADTPRWPARTTFVNASLPGFTSADACAFYFHFAERLAGLRAVILFLGHCDAASTELPKRRYTFLRQLRSAFRQRIGLQAKRTTLRNRLTPYEWNAGYDPTLEAPEDPADFESNLRRVIQACRRRDVSVILVRPQAHRLFPPGVGKGNFIFYRYLGLRDRFAPWVKLEDERFNRASRLHDDGRQDEAMSIYRAILEESGPLSDSPEYLLVVTNNYAVAAAEAGRHAEARVLLELLLNERGARREIVLFNLAELARIRGDDVERRALLDQACESDHSLYRVRQPYLEAVDRLAAEFKDSIRSVDMRELVPQSMFVDHCHPRPAGQERLAQAMSEAFTAVRLRGESRAVIENRLYNPELALGNRAEFFGYFKTFAPYSPDQIGRWIDRPEDAPEELGHARQYFLKHPFFTDPRDIAHYRPRYPSDVGRFPEYFIIRHTIPYLRLLERLPRLRDAFQDGDGLLHASEDLLRILPPAARSQVESADPAVDAEYEGPHVDAVLQRVRSELTAHLLRGPQIYERMKTTLYWYFRETLRFGAHSRASMRYDRVFLEYAAESLAMTLVIDDRIGGGREKEIRRMILWLEDASRIHERHADGFSLEASLEDRDRRVQTYDAELRALAERVQKAQEPVL